MTRLANAIPATPSNCLAVRCIFIIPRGPSQTTRPVDNFRQADAVEKSSERKGDERHLARDRAERRVRLVNQPSTQTCADRPGNGYRPESYSQALPIALQRTSLSDKPFPRSMI